MKLLGNLKIGRIFVLSAPAGTGKTTLIKMLVEEFPCVIQSISYTTRPKRYNEKSGDDYIFVSRKEFEQKIAEREFLEYVKLYGHYYGTSKKWVEEQQLLGKHFF
jgi:guanylate kinase